MEAINALDQAPILSESNKSLVATGNSQPAAVALLKDGKGSETFAQLLGKLSQDVQGDLSESMDLSNLIALFQNHPETLMAMMEWQDHAELKEATRYLHQMLLPDQSTVEKLLAQHPGLLRWFEQVSAMLETTIANGVSEVPEQSVNPGQALIGQAIPTDASELQRIIAQFESLAQKYPQDPQVQRLRNELIQLVQSLAKEHATPPQPLAETDMTSSLRLNSSAVGVPNAALAGNELHLEQLVRTGTNESSLPTMSDRLPVASPDAKALLELLGIRSGMTTTSLESSLASLAATSPEGRAESDSGGNTSNANPMFHMAQLLHSQQPFTMVPSDGSPAVKQSALMNAFNFAQEMSQYMMKNMRITHLQGGSQARITLVPEHLGQVDVKISMINGQLMATFVAGSLQAKEALESQLPLLRQALQNQGIQVERLEVSQQHQLQTETYLEDGRHHPSQQFSGSSFGKRSPYEQHPQEFADELEEMEQQQRMMYGSTFHATA